MTSFKELIGAYLSGSEVLRKAIAGMSREHLLARPIPGKWSTLECVAHITDFEPIMADRMKRIISHDRPLLLVADENRFAAALAYHERDINEELALIDATRKQMGRILKALPHEAASRVGIHSFKGFVTLEAVLAGAVNHVAHHVEFIDEKRQALKV